jgi:hypothetical protein
MMKQPKIMYFDFRPPLGGVFHPNADGSVKLAFNPEQLGDVSKWANEFTGMFLEMARIQQKMFEKGPLDKPVVIAKNVPVVIDQHTISEPNLTEENPPDTHRSKADELSTMIGIWKGLTPEERITFGTKCMEVVAVENGG